MMIEWIVIKKHLESKNPNAFYYIKNYIFKEDLNMSAVVAINEETRRMEQ